MKLSIWTKFLRVYVIVLGLFVSSCVQNGGGKKKSSSSSDTESKAADGGVDSGSGSGVGTGANPSEGGLTAEEIAALPPKVELRHIVDPFDGSFKSKVSIPKNFSGMLFLAGLNLASVKEAGRIVKVRFNFGRALEAIEVPALIQSAEGFGITPQTKVDVLMIDLGNTKVFESLRLSYDLFDYNDYRTAGVEAKDLVIDPRDSGLFCRGLNLEYDPTFERTATNTQCDTAGETCNYAYAKVRDSGLYYDKVISGTTFSVFEVPSLMQIDYSGLGYSSDLAERAARKCLPDNEDIDNFKSILNDTTLAGGVLLNGANLTVNSVNYTYKGPYFNSGASDWQISGGAIYSAVNSTTTASGIYQYNSGTNGLDYKSFLFPRAGKVELNDNVAHYSSATPFSDPLSLNTLLSAGKTDWMNGCNLRVQHYDSSTNETISSCNVTAQIEIVYEKDGVEDIIASSTDLKLQIVKAFESDADATGANVLDAALVTCENSQACGSGSCCFNNRCWSKDLVSQCLEDVTTSGNKRTGETCGTDLECSSLCCSATQGNTCQPHVTSSDEDTTTSSCGKSLGQSCISKEFCQKESVIEYYLIRGSGNSCNYIAISKQVNGDCVNGLCSAPSQTALPDDYATPDCANALPKLPDGL